MKFKIYIIGFLFMIAPAFADDVNIPDITYPSLPKTGADIQAFIPNNWLIEKIVFSDFNNDGRDDVVLVLRRVENDDVVLYGDDKSDIYINKPRVLAVLFKEENGYRLELQDNKILFTDHSDDMFPSDMNDPFFSLGGGWVNANKDILSLAIGYSSRAGSSFGRFTYTFRYQDQNFELIGYDFFNSSKGSREMYNESFNLLTGKCGVQKKLIDDDNEKWAWGKIPIKPLITIDQIDQFASVDCPASYDDEDK